jgi:hypothetical protein
MEWVIAYLVSIILAATFYGLIVTNRSHESRTIKLSHAEEVIQALGFCLIWPISMTIRSIITVRADYKKECIERAENLISKYSFNSNSKHDRSFILNVPEPDLKFMLKTHRKKLFKLEATVVDMIREELLNRNMERNLLK